MICVLQVSPDGTVLGANEASMAFLGPCVGRRCCDVIRAESAQRFLCGPLCAGEIGDGSARTIERTVRIRGQLCRIACTRVRDEVIVAIVPEGASGVPVAFPLSRREREVLEAVARGLTNVEVARALGVAASTVRSHLDSARSKLGASNRAHAVALALATHQLQL